MRSSTKAIGCLLATSLAFVLTACGITITAVHLPDEVQVNVGATAETAATYESNRKPILPHSRQQQTKSTGLGRSGTIALPQSMQTV